MRRALSIQCRHRTARLLVGCVLGLTVFGAQARSNLELGFRLDYTDNVDLAETDETSDLLRVPYIEFGWDNEGRELTARLDGRFEYLDYRDNTSNDDTVGELSAVADWAVIENRLNLHVEDRFQQVRFQELDPETPENTEDANTFIIGPDLLFAPTPVDEIKLGARYGDTYFERGSDSERWVYGAIWTHQLSAINEFGVSVQRQEVEFLEENIVTDEDPIVQRNRVEDFTVDEVGIGFTRRLERGQANLTLGTRQIDRDNSETLERGFARVDWSYTPTRRTEFELRGESGLTDTGVRLIDRNRPTVELPAADAFNNEDILVLSEVQARLLRRGARLDVALGVRATEEDFETNNLDRESYGGGIGLEYFLSPSNRVFANVRAARTDYLLIDRRDDDLTAGLRLRHLLGPRFFTELGYNWWERESSEAGSSFEENRVFVAAGYRWGE